MVGVKLCCGDSLMNGEGFGGARMGYRTSAKCALCVPMYVDFVSWLLLLSVTTRHQGRHFTKTIGKVQQNSKLEGLRHYQGYRARLVTTPGLLLAIVSSL